MILSRNPINEQEGNREETFLDEATHERIRRHIADKNDVISEEDIRNVRTDIYDAASKTSQPVNGEVNIGEAERIVNSEEENQPGGPNPVLTPWSVLNS